MAFFAAALACSCFSIARCAGPRVRYGYHSALEESPWLSVDLGRHYSISNVKVYGRGDEYSTNRSRWRSRCQRMTRPIVKSPNGPSRCASDPWVVKPTGVTAQFVRLHTLRNSYLVLGEVEAFGSKAK